MVLSAALIHTPLMMTHSHVYVLIIHLLQMQVGNALLVLTQIILIIQLQHVRGVLTSRSMIQNNRNVFVLINSIKINKASVFHVLNHNIGIKLIQNVLLAYKIKFTNKNKENVYVETISHTKIVNNSVKLAKSLTYGQKAKNFASCVLKG